MANSDFHYIEIYDNMLSSQLVRIDRFTSLWYEDTVDKGAQAQFTIPYNRPELTRANITGMNRVKIYKGDTQKWEGFINRWSVKGNEVTVELLNLMGVLEKRLVNENFTAQAAGDIFAEIISDMNVTDDTGITSGTFEYGGNGIDVDSIDDSTDTITATSHGISNDQTVVLVTADGTMPTPIVSQTPYYVINKTDDTLQLSLTQGGSAINLTDAGTGTFELKIADRAFNFANQTILSALQTIAHSVGSEFFVDFGAIAKVLESRGSDKSNGEVDFKSMDSKPNESNLQEVDVIYDMSKTYNKIIGTGNSLTSTKENTTSQGTYGLLEQAVSFPNISDQATLDQETEIEVGIVDNPFEIPKALVVNEKINESLYDVGDTIKVKLERGFYELDSSYRIVSKRVIVRGDNQQVDVEVGLSSSSQSRADVLNEIAESVRRVYNLERAA